VKCSGFVQGLTLVDAINEIFIREYIHTCVGGIQPPLSPDEYSLRYVRVRLPDSDDEIRM